MLLALAGAAAAESPDELAAMLLSPNEKLRSHAARQVTADNAIAVLRHMTRWAANRAAWVDALEARAKEVEGAELAKVQRMLRHLAGAQREHIGVDVYFVSMPKEMGLRILGDVEATVVHGAKSRAWTQWWQWIRDDKRTEEFLSRAVAGEDTRPASAKHLRQVSYVKDYKLVEQGKALDPVLGVLQTGVSIAWTPSLSEDQRHITLDVELKRATLKRPIATAEIRRGERMVKVQRPDVSRVEMRKRISLPAGGQCAWRVPDPEAEAAGTIRLVLLRAAHGEPLPLDAPTKVISDGVADATGR